MVKRYSRLGKAAVLTGALMGGVAGTVLAQEAPVTNVLVTDFNVNTDLSGCGFKFGGRYNFNDDLGFGLGVDIESIIPLDRIGIRAGLGLYAELKTGVFVPRVGFDYWSNNRPSVFGELACELPFDNQVNLRIGAGYDTERKLYASLGCSVKDSRQRFNNKK
jgi:hypothetical protein